MGNDHNSVNGDFATKVEAHGTWLAGLLKNIPNSEMRKICGRKATSALGSWRAGKSVPQWAKDALVSHWALEAERLQAEAERLRSWAVRLQSYPTDAAEARRRAVRAWQSKRVRDGLPDWRQGSRKKEDPAVAGSIK